MRSNRRTPHFLVALVAVISVAATSSAQTLSATADAYLSGVDQNGNQGSSTALQLRDTPERAIVRFSQTDILNATAGGTLLSASLELFIEARPI